VTFSLFKDWKSFTDKVTILKIPWFLPAGKKLRISKLADDKAVPSFNPRKYLFVLRLE